MATSLVVHLDIAPDKFDDFLAIVRPHGEYSVANEPGCLSFQVMLPKEAPHQVILVEVYEDEAALEGHWASAHMAAYREKVADMILERKSIPCTL